MRDTLGHLLIRIEEIPWVSKLPVGDINDWTMIQPEDMLSREGGRDVIHLMEGPGGGAIGPGRAQASHTLAIHASKMGAARGGAPPATPPTPISQRISHN
jgi:hypothetical protein